MPKTAAAGVYTGTATVTLDGTANTLPVRVRVFDYTLPDEVSIMSCIPLQRGYLFNGELDNSESMYAKYAERLRQYRLSVQYLNSVQFRASESAEDIAYILERETTVAAQAAKMFRYRAMRYACIPKTTQWEPYSTKIISISIFARM